MSEVQSVRVRSQRSAAAAVERARLTVVGNRPTSARRAPFAILVFLILGAGVVGLLMFNTHMQQASIYATQLQQKANRLQAKSEALARETDGLRDPQHLAISARGIGMVNPQNPAFVNLMNGRIEGTPTAATAEDGTDVRPNPPPLPAIINPKPIFQVVTAQPVSANTGTQPGTNRNPNKPVKGAQR